MEVGVDVNCMCTKFGGHDANQFCGCGHSGFGDFAPFQILVNFPFGPWAIILGIFMPQNWYYYCQLFILFIIIKGLQLQQYLPSALTLSKNS